MSIIINYIFFTYERKYHIFNNYLRQYNFCYNVIYIVDRKLNVGHIIFALLPLVRNSIFQNFTPSNVTVTLNETLSDNMIHSTKCTFIELSFTNSA